MEVTFESLGLSQAMLKALEQKGYGYPTTIQAEAIHYLLHEDLQRRFQDFLLPIMPS